MHDFKSLDKRRAAIGVDEMIAAMNSSSNSVGVSRAGDAVSDGEHDGVTVRHDGNFHGVFGIVSVGDIEIVGEGGAGKFCADIGDIEQDMFNA